MLKNFVILFALLGGLALEGFSQTQPRTETVRTTSEEIWVDQLASFQMQYLLDEFTQGIIYFSKRGPARGKINYNILMDALQYYDEEGNLKTVPRNEPLDSAVVGPHVLIPYNNALVEIFRTENGPLLLHRTISYKLERLVRGAYGSIERTSAVDQVSSIMGRGELGQDFKVTNPSKQEMELLLRYQQQYYLPVGDDQFIELSNRRNVARAFPDHSGEVNSFIRKNKIDFDSTESMKKLAGFLHTLQD